jgi:hypothetical protein
LQVENRSVEINHRVKHRFPEFFEP